MDKNCLVIAEAGVNHNGDLDIARALVEAAANAGADMIKFQTFKADRIATKDAPKAYYQTGSGDPLESQFEMLRKLELTEDMHLELVAHCSKHDIGFLSTGFDVESLEYLSALGIEMIKIPSGEITNLPYLRRVGSFGKQVILSTGMATLGEIEAALDILEMTGMSRSKITVLHCNTEYPTPVRDVNLKAMCSIRDAFGVSVGYSDHTIGIEVPIAAVALGASIIEKHLTLDRGMLGPDHRASIEPTEFAAMVGAIRNIEQAIGDGIKRPSNSEIKNRIMVRKSIVAAKPISAGECFTEENILVKRPGSGISPMRWDEVLGRKAPCDFVTNALIVI